MNLKKNNYPFQILSIIICLIFIVGCNDKGQQITVSSELESKKIQFAIDEINTAIAERSEQSESGETANANIVFTIQPDNAAIKIEGFRITKDGRQIKIIASHESGAMYGGLEVAEQIKISGIDGITEQDQNPYMERRGTKFNIPLDVRTPSYTHPCDAAQKNIAEMWNFDFWKEYIDNLARYRYNFISLWSLHPFPSMVKVPGYEDVALDDVQRSSINWEEYYSIQGIGFDSPEILANPETLIKISMDDKIKFWKKVMAYGKSRNVDFYVVTWNIFVNGANDKYGITDEIDNPITRDYFRKSVKQMFVTYPDLGGIGLTTGENMRDQSTKAKEDWAFETYAKGVLDAAAEMPDRKITFIHRQHQAGATEIAEKFKPLFDNKNIEFIFSFKYAKAHVMSATKQPYHQAFVKDIGDMKTIWTLRNDDNYYFRWGAPDFVREFIKNIPMEVSRGYYYGSDQWIWGREFTMKNPEGERQIEIVKHWYHWMMWGRLGYNPEITNERFAQILQNHFPETEGGKLLDAWQEASMIYPTTTGFHWAPLDFHWYIEACRGRERYTNTKTGFHDVNVFIRIKPHKESGFQSIPVFVKMIIDGGFTELKTPLQVADKLHAHANKAMAFLETTGDVENKELKITLNDIKSMALLGEYYAFKIAGSTQLALYRETKDIKYQKAAISELEKALEAWKAYTEKALQQNINPIWTNRVGYVDWVKITDWVAQDIEIAKEK
ncbi:MAG: hypothetical protein KAS71_09550 [Bacteroidales bacterium]|nr:hypothetical protein [Bacteroidales bacterium]